KGRRMRRPFSQDETGQLALRHSDCAFLYSSPFLPLFFVAHSAIFSCWVLGAAAAAGAPPAFRHSDWAFLYSSPVLPLWALAQSSFFCCCGVISFLSAGLASAGLASAGLASAGFVLADLVSAGLASAALSAA